MPGAGNRCISWARVESHEADKVRYSEDANYGVQASWRNEKKHSGFYVMQVLGRYCSLS